MSEFIPNSFQTPNAYIDKFMALLSGTEYKILSFAARRIFGFQKRQDNISLSQFSNGTGMGISATKKAIDSLIAFGFIFVVAPNDPQKNRGKLYELQLDSNLVDIDAMKHRHQNRLETNRKRTSKARDVLKGTPPSVPHTPPSGTTPPPGSPTDPPPLCGTETQKTSLNPSLNPFNDDEEETPQTERPNIFKLYENHIGLITEPMKDKLIHAEEDYPAEWIEAAFDIATENNARSWKYVTTVLQNMKTKGRHWSPKKNGRKGSKPSKQRARLFDRS